MRGMSSSLPADDVAALAALAEPMRRRLYEMVVARGEPVSRDAAAGALGITRSLAAFHLDRLADAGLLSVEFRRLGGRSGPGAGRPSKLYRRSLQELQMSVPPRRYRLAAGWLAQAMASDAPAETLRGLASDHGRRLGRLARRRAGSRPSRGALMAAGAETLSDEGFAARVEDGAIRLGNCPFELLARDQPELVCSEMNRALLTGFAAGLGGRSAAAFEPNGSGCCMTLR